MGLSLFRSFSFYSSSPQEIVTKYTKGTNLEEVSIVFRIDRYYLPDLISWDFSQPITYSPKLMMIRMKLNI